MGCPAFTVLECLGVLLALCGKSCYFLVPCLSHGTAPQLCIWLRRHGVLWAVGNYYRKDLTQAENPWYLGYYGAATLEADTLNAMCDERGAKPEKKVCDWSSTSSKELEIRVEHSRVQSCHSGTCSKTSTSQIWFHSQKSQRNPFEVQWLHAVLHDEWLASIAVNSKCLSQVQSMEHRVTALLWGWAGEPGTKRGWNCHLWAGSLLASESDCSGNYPHIFLFN